MEIAEFQQRIRDCYYDKDAARGRLGTFAWLVEEVGELSRDLRRGDPLALADEFADVFAWLASLASLCGIDLDTAVAKYAGGCPKCSASPCRCDEPRFDRRIVLGGGSGRCAALCYNVGVEKLGEWRNLVDAQGSGPCACKGVRVRVPPRPPEKSRSEIAPAFSSRHASSAETP